MNPMPEDFAPTINRETVRGVTMLTWRGTLTCGDARVQLEYGIRHDDPEAMRRDVWRIHESARLGDAAALAAYRRDRHGR